MRIVAKKFILQSVFEKVFSSTSSSPIDQTLRSVLLQAFDGGICVIGGDGDTLMKSFVSDDHVAVQEYGDAILSPKLMKVIKTCPDRDIQIETTANRLGISIPDTETNWHFAKDTSKYPVIDHAVSIIATVPKDRFIRALDLVYPAIRTENIRQMFDFVQITHNFIRATDGAKFAQTHFPYALEALLPGRSAFGLLRRLRRTVADSIGIGEDERAYFFFFGDDIFIIMKYNIHYPNVHDMLASYQQDGDTAIIDRKELIDAIKRVSISADVDVNYVSMELQRSGGLRLDASDRVGSSAVAHVPAPWQGVSPWQVGLNYTHLLALLAPLHGDTVTLRFPPGQRGRLGPICLETEDYFGMVQQLSPQLADFKRRSKAKVEDEDEVLEL